jgi:hypothetical protein
MFVRWPHYLQKERLSGHLFGGSCAAKAASALSFADDFFFAATTVSSLSFGQLKSHHP